MKKTIRHMDNERGVALLMVLLISTITLAVTTTMLYMLTQSTRYSGMGKRFTTGSEAAMAGSEVITEFLSPGADTLAYRSGLVSKLQFWPEPQPADTDCEAIKINYDTTDPEWGPCSKSILIDPADTSTFDVKFEMGNYDVYSKIVYTFKGNTAGTKTENRGWRNTCVIHCQGGGDRFTPAISTAYIIEIDARNRTRPTEGSRLSVLFQY
jgi:hypothetical protein